MATTDYLKRRGETWFVRVQIPKHLWKAAGGKREYVRTLKTRDLSEANRLKHSYVAAFKQQIIALERGTPEQPDDLYEKALAWRETMLRHKNEVLYKERDGTPYYSTDEFLSQISEEAEEVLAKDGEKAAGAFYRVAKGEGTLIAPHVDTWLMEQGERITEQTKAQHRTVLRAFAAWAGAGAFVEDVTRRYAGEFVSHLLAPSSGLSRKTTQRYLSSLSSLWTWLEARGLAQSNPWTRHGVGKKPKRGEATQRNQWSDSALVKLLTGSYTQRYTETLHDLIKLALVTGARLDELCALKPEHVQKQRDGWWMTIMAGKTGAAVRDVPVHQSAAHVLERRRGRAKGFLFDGLIPGGPDKKRSWNVSKAFGHYARSLELGEARHTFHELRNTFVETMEAAEVPESTTKLIVGHARTSMTYGRYSKGQRVQLREAINKLHYPANVMRLIRAPTRDDKLRRGNDTKRPSQRTKKTDNSPADRRKRPG
jgi:integrase